MEEILSSIKRIIAEEGEAATTTRPRRAAARTAPVMPSAIDLEDEILELSEPAPSPAIDMDREPPQRAAPQPRAEQHRPEPRTEALRGESAYAQPRTITPPPAETPSIGEAAARVETILSERAAEASRQPLEALSRMIVKPEVAGSDTLEGMVRELVRPMLREWLDANLPRIVETMVAREISRISNRG